MKKHARKFFFQNMFFYHFSYVPPAMNHTKPIKSFWGKQISVIFFSPEYIFTFLSSAPCTPADNNVVRKKFMKNGFQKKYLFWKNCFFSKFLCNPIGKFYRTFPKKFYECNILWRKKILRRMFFFHLTLALRSPTKNNVIQNIFLKNYFLRKSIKY